MQFFCLFRVTCISSITLLNKLQLQIAWKSCHDLYLIQQFCFQDLAKDHCDLQFCFPDLAKYYCNMHFRCWPVAYLNALCLRTFRTSNSVLPISTSQVISLNDEMEVVQEASPDSHLSHHVSATHPPYVFFPRQKISIVNSASRSL